MDKRDWELSSGSLRKILREFAEQGPVCNRIVGYKFGLDYNPQYAAYYLWNSPTQRVLATFKIPESSKNVFIRYRPRSIYRYELFKFKMPEHKSVFVPSETLDRHRDWAANRLNQRVERATQDIRATFLDRNQSSRPSSLRLDISVHLPGPSPTLRGIQPQGSATVRVHFNSSEQLGRLHLSTVEKVQWLVVNDGLRGFVFETRPDTLEPICETTIEHVDDRYRELRDYQRIQPTLQEYGTADYNREIYNVPNATWQNTTITGSTAAAAYNNPAEWQQAIVDEMTEVRNNIPESLIRQIMGDSNETRL